MNTALTEQIIYHILANFGVLPATFIDWNKTQSLVDKQYLLPKKLIFTTEDGDLQKNVYGCQLKTGDSKSIKILLADCTKDKLLPEYGLLVQLENSPAYGLYVISNKLMEAFYDELPDSEPMIAVSLNNKDWMMCNTFLQATFLAGMEQIKDLGYNWATCTNYQSQFEALQSLINFHEVLNEGQEN